VLCDLNDLHWVSFTRPNTGWRQQLA
jgi:hypothetical protein